MTIMTTIMKKTIWILAMVLVGVGIQAASWLPSKDAATNFPGFSVDLYGKVTAIVTNTPDSDGGLYFLQISNAPVLIHGVSIWRCPTGFSTIYNPYQPTRGVITNTLDCSVTNLIYVTNSPLILYTFNQTNLEWSVATARTNGTWTVPTFQMSPNRPLLIENLSGKTFTNKLIGLLRTGDFTNRFVPNVINFVCSQIYKDGYLSEVNPTNSTRGLNLPGPTVFDKAYVMINGVWQSTTYMNGNGWAPITNYNVSTTQGPWIHIGQCFFYKTSNTNAWLQSAHY